MRPFSFLLCVTLLAGCERGNDLHRYSGRVLRVGITNSSGGFLATLVRNKPESGCLQLHPEVTATFDGIPLQVFPGAPIIDPDLCNSPDSPPAFTGRLDPQLFLGAPRNGVMEIRDGDESIIAEFRNFFGRHTFAQLNPPPSVKPGEELFLPWDPPTDDLSVIEKVTLLETDVPARPEAGGVRFTIPSDTPTGRVKVIVRGSDIPVERCEGVAGCTADSLLILDRSTLVNVQP
ncbi:MAG: hypothetical protein ACJ8AT_13335 [Hyalangium sp.]|uniref:hypothetical protein n=1 Tax=Hyalangium sp. TaxID=2028555 RepID=UPI003899DC0C